MADTGDFDPIGRRPWPVLPEFRPSAQRVWEQQRSAPLPITTTQGEMRWGPALAPAPLVSRLGDSTGLNPGVNPEMADLFAEIGERLGHGDFKGAALPIAGAVTGITQGKIRQGAKPKGQTKPDFAAGNFPPGFDTQKDKQGFYLKSKLVLDQMMKGNVNDNPVRVEYIRKQLKNHGITDAEINALKLPELLAKGPYIRRSEVLKHVNENRPEIQHAYYAGKEGQGGVQMMKVGDKADPDFMRNGVRVVTYKDPTSGRSYEMHRSGPTNDAGPQEVMKVKDVETGQWLDMPRPYRPGGPDSPPVNRWDEADAFQAMRQHVKKMTSTIPPGAVGGTHYAGGNLVLDATAPHQEHAWGLGPNKEWAEAAAHHQQLYAEQAKLNDIIDAGGKQPWNQPEAHAAWKRLKENKAEIEASDRRLTEINAGRYKAGHITGGPDSNWDYLTHSRVAPVEFQAQGTRVPGTLVEERQTDRKPWKGARASPQEIARAEEARNRAVKENQDAYEEARNWVSNVNPDVDWRTAFAGRQEGTYGGGDATMVASRSETQADINNALQHLRNMRSSRLDPIIGDIAEARLMRLKDLDEAESARHEELKAARAGVPKSGLTDTFEAFNKFAAKTELLQAAKNAQAQGLPESASYWIGATPGPEQNARYGKSQQVRGLRLDTQNYDNIQKDLADTRKAYEEAVADPDYAKHPHLGRPSLEVLKERLDAMTQEAKKAAYNLYYRPWSPPGAASDAAANFMRGKGGEWVPWHKPVPPHQLPELLGPDLHKRLLDSRLPDNEGGVPPRFSHELKVRPGTTIGGQAFDRTYGDNAFTPGTVNDTLHAQLRKLDPNTPEWTTANILHNQRTKSQEQSLREDPSRVNEPTYNDPHFVQQKRRPYGLDPREPNPPVALRAHEMTPEARRKINEQGFSLFQLPIAAGIGASALAGSMLDQYGDPQEDQQ